MWCIPWNISDVLLTSLFEHQLEPAFKWLFPVIVDVQHRCVKFKYIVAGDGTYQNARLSVQKRTLLTRFSDELFSVQGRTSSSWSSEAVDVQSFADYQVNSYVIEVVSPDDSQNTVKEESLYWL